MPNTILKIVSTFGVLAMLCGIGEAMGGLPNLGLNTYRKFTISYQAHPIHPQCSWKISIDGGGQIVISHDLWNKSRRHHIFTESKAYVLPEDETAQVWRLIDAANIIHRNTSTRVGVPNEVMYDVSLINGRENHAASILEYDVADDIHFLDLVDYLSELVKKYYPDVSGKEGVARC